MVSLRAPSLACRVEQAYVDAYEGEGWRGANREKVRSAADLEHARLQVCAPEQAAFNHMCGCHAICGTTRTVVRWLLVFFWRSAGRGGRDGSG